MDINATLFGQTLAMIVFVWFCMKMVWPPLLEMIETRQKEIADGLTAAEKGRNSLDDAKAEVDRLVGEAVDRRQCLGERHRRRAPHRVGAERLGHHRPLQFGQRRGCAGCRDRDRHVTKGHTAKITILPIQWQLGAGVGVKEKRTGGDFNGEIGTGLCLFQKPRKD